MSGITLNQIGSVGDAVEIGSKRGFSVSGDTLKLANNVTRVGWVGSRLLDTVSIIEGIDQDGGEFGRNASKATINAGVGWVGSSVGATLGASAGAKLGAAAGSFAGPVGTVVGAVAGATLLPIIGSEAVNIIYESF